MYVSEKERKSVDGSLFRVFICCLLYQFLLLFLLQYHYLRRYFVVVAGKNHSITQLRAREERIAINVKEMKREKREKYIFFEREGERKRLSCLLHLILMYVEDVLHVHAVFVNVT